VYRAFHRVILLTVVLPAGPALAQEAAVDTLTLKAHTHFLAHDLLRGRATGTQGARLAAVYIEAQCRALGLHPVQGAYTQQVPLERALILRGTRLEATAPGGSLEFAYPQDFTPNVGTRATLGDFAGPTVFVGDSRRVTEGGLAEVGITGHVAVTLGPFLGAAVDTLARRGAAGMIHLVGDAQSYQLYARSRGASRLYHAEADVRSSFMPELPSIIAGPRIARLLMAGATRGRDQEIPPQPLPWAVTVFLELERSTAETANVACMLPGSHAGAADTAIAFTAHYDHLGIGEPDADGDSLYNGFSDNAAGVAMLLAIAQTLAREDAEPLRYSTLFLFPGAEERGLLGSDYYAARPLWPLEQTAAVINLDAGAPPAPPVSWRLAGVDSTGLGGVAIRVAEEHGWQITTSPARPNSDYYPFAREGVPALFIIPGPAPYEGLSSDSSKVLRHRWDAYHQPGDEWAEDFPFSGLARYAGFALEIARAIDDGAALRSAPRP
jgi:hypothetical protein